MTTSPHTRVHTDAHSSWNEQQENSLYLIHPSQTLGLCGTWAYGGHGWLGRQASSPLSRWCYSCLVLGGAFRTGTFGRELTDGEDSKDILAVFHMGCLIQYGHLAFKIMFPV